MDGRRPRRQRLGDRQHYHFFILLGRDRGLLRSSAAGDGDVVKSDVDRIQRDLGGRLQYPDGNSFIAVKRGLFKMRRKSEFVVLRCSRFRQALCCRQGKCYRHKDKYRKNSLHISSEKYSPNPFLNEVGMD